MSSSLVRTAAYLVGLGLGRGVLASDESTSTIGKRFAALGVENTEEHRRMYRESLLTAEGLETHVTGVILTEETMGQSTKDGRRFVDVLAERGIHSGCKVDKGLQPLEPLSANPEQMTTGLDGLAERCRAAKQAGCTFTKWRAALQVVAAPEEDNARGVPALVRPSGHAVEAMANAMARYAAVAQSEGLVPIVEPELLMDGAHTAEQAARANEVALSALFAAMHRHGVLFEGALLKCSMVTPGKDSGGGSEAHTPLIASLTVRTLMRTVPPAMAGVVFLSGGQSDADAARNLHAVRAAGLAAGCPFPLTFSFGRALHNSALAAWAPAMHTDGPANAASSLVRNCAACSGL